MTAIRFLMDEGVPVSVGRVLEDGGHDVIFFKESGLAKGSPDTLVCVTAEINDAVLVAADGDMKQLAKSRGVSAGRFKRMGLLKFECRKPTAASRMRLALSLLEHEWGEHLAGKSPRLYVVIGESMFRSHR